MTPNETDWRKAALVCREVAELPDRESCDHMTPDDMIVTANELQPIVVAALAEARADERKKLVAMLRRPSVDTREALMTATWEATPAEIEALIKVLADLLERAP